MKKEDLYPDRKRDSMRIGNRGRCAQVYSARKYWWVARIAVRLPLVYYSISVAESNKTRVDRGSDRTAEVMGR